MKILVIGGAGFLGAHVVRRCLQESGNRVTVLYSLEAELHATTEHLQPVWNRIRFIRGSIGDEPLIADAVQAQDVIFSLAAQTSHPRSIQNPLLDAEINCLGKIRLLEAVRMLNDVKDIVRCRQRLALEETAKFIELNMLNVPHFPDKFTLLDQAINAVSKEGLFCEFGVYNGQSINFIASKINTVIYGFDSFEGLPEDWLREFRKGRFKVNNLPEVRENVSLIKGWFDEVLPEFAEQHAEQCSFIHIDCDLYSSTKTIFHHLKNRISTGTVIVFDEFFNFPGWKDWEYKAFAEFIADGDAEFEFLGYYRHGEQVAVKITRVG